MSEHDREYGYEKMLYYDADFFDCILFFTWCMKKLSKNRCIIWIFSTITKIYHLGRWNMKNCSWWPQKLAQLFVYWLFIYYWLLSICQWKANNFFFAIHSFLYFMQYLIFTKKIRSLLCFENYNFRFYSLASPCWFISSMYSVHIT